MNSNVVLKSFLNVTVTGQKIIKIACTILRSSRELECIKTKISLSSPIDYKPSFRKSISLSNGSGSYIACDSKVYDVFENKLNTYDKQQIAGSLKIHTDIH